MATVVRIVREKDGVSRNFIFLDAEVKTSNPSTTSMSVSLTFPKDDPSDSGEDFTIDLGVSQEISFEWKLYDEDTDRSEGTHTSLLNGIPAGTIKTFGEMLDYLEDIIFYPGIGTIDYHITVTDKFRTKTYKCSYDSSSINIDTGLYPTRNMKFKIKGVE